MPVSWNFSSQSNYHCSWNQTDFTEFELSLYYDSLQTKLMFASHVSCKMYNSYMYKVQQKFWMHPLKIMILFAWSWNTNIIYSEVNNKISLRPCWLLLYTFDVPVIESPTAVAIQNYTQLDDPVLNFYFHHNNADKAVQLYLI